MAERTVVDCIYRGMATSLEISGVPVCPICAQELKAGGKPAYREPPGRASSREESSGLGGQSERYLFFPKKKSSIRPPHQRIDNDAEQLYRGGTRREAAA